MKGAQIESDAMRKRYSLIQTSTVEGHSLGVRRSDDARSKSEHKRQISKNIHSNGYFAGPLSSTLVAKSIYSL